MENDAEWIGFVFRKLGGKAVLASVAVPKLDSFKFLFAFPLLDDLVGGAVRTGFGGSADGSGLVVGLWVGGRGHGGEMVC